MGPKRDSMVCNHSRPPRRSSRGASGGSGCPFCACTARLSHRLPCLEPGDLPVCAPKLACRETQFTVCVRIEDRKKRPEGRPSSDLEFNRLPADGSPCPERASISVQATVSKSGWRLETVLLANLRGAMHRKWAVSLCRLIVIISVIYRQTLFVSFAQAFSKQQGWVTGSAPCFTQVPGRRVNVANVSVKMSKVAVSV